MRNGNAMRRSSLEHDGRVLVALLAGVFAGMLLALATSASTSTSPPPSPAQAQADSSSGARAPQTVLKRSGSHGVSSLPRLRSQNKDTEREYLDDGSESLYNPDHDTLSAIIANVTAHTSRRELLVAVANSALLSEDGSRGMLRTWLEQVWHTGISNYAIVALDDQIATSLTKLRVPHWRRQPASLADWKKDNHGISAQKFDILHDFLKRGTNVLLSDVDVVVFRNPFNLVYRDADVEGMSDGFDERTAYGHIDGIDDPSMGWSRYAQALRIVVTNSGLFYLRSTHQSRALMQRCTDRLMEKKDWDQSVLNEELFYPSHGSYLNPGATKRVMDINDFMNSKYLFKTVRHSPTLRKHIPAMVHLNYHPDKHERMRAVVRYFHDDDPRALEAWPDGSCWHPPECK